MSQTSTYNSGLSPGLLFHLTLYALEILLLNLKVSCIDKSVTMSRENRRSRRGSDESDRYHLAAEVHEESPTNRTAVADGETPTGNKGVNKAGKKDVFPSSSGTHSFLWVFFASFNTK